MQRLRGTLQRSLFPPSPSADPRLGGWEAVLLLIAFLALAIILQLLRLGPANALETLWAEDGPVFLHRAIVEGPLDATTATYAGYLVVIPRLIGELGALVPLPAATATMNLAASSVIALCGIAVWVASAGHIRSPVLRGLLVALTVLSPVAGVEAVVSGTYVIWYASFAVFWLLLWQPATTLGAALGGLFVLLTGLSSPATFFFAPLAALRAIAIRDRRDALIVGAFALALAVQLPVTVLSAEELVEPEWSHHIWTVFLQRVVDGSVLGLELGGSAWESWGWTFVTAIAVALGVYLLVLWLRAASGRLLAAIAVVTSVALFVASIYQRAAALAMLWWPDMHTAQGGRYAIVPSLLLVSAAFVLVEGAPKRSRVWILGATAAVMLVALVTSFDVGQRNGPPWDDSLRASALTCREAGGEDGVVYVSPEGTTMLVPCERLESAYPAPTP